MSFHGSPFILLASSAPPATGDGSEAEANTNLGAPKTKSSGRIDGSGMYKYPSGNVYVGEFNDGQFHGRGTLYFKTGGRYDADWENGVAKNGKYTFADGLEYDRGNWDYCTEADRRFYSERTSGFSV